MELVLLGTGAADGWPNPFCRCASCASARTTGDVRGQTSALIDGVLWFDCGPEAPRAAQRLGVDVTGVRHLVFTHAHPDHLGPAALMWRGWVQGEAPLDVVGPPAVLAAVREWIAPGAPVRLVEAQPGEELALGDYMLRVLPARHSTPDIGPAVFYDISHAGSRMLWATDTGPLPELAVLPDAGYDLVCLELTFGDRTDHGEDHLDLSTWPQQVARLRAARAVNGRTRLVAIHLGHHNPPTAELARRLATWGAEVHPDGSQLLLGGAPPAATRPVAQRTLVLGGARSGKSTYAESLLLAEPEVTYVATGGARAGDEEWQARVQQHVARRPAHWSTLELDKPADLPQLLRSSTDVLLVDCLTLWLTSAMDDAGAWDGGDVTQAVAELLDAWRTTRARVVAVSNEVGSGVVPDTTAGRLFRDALGALNAAVAAQSESVLHVVAGIPRELRGR